jgi:hypothetical protein
MDPLIPVLEQTAPTALSFGMALFGTRRKGSELGICALKCACFPVLYAFIHLYKFLVHMPLHQALRIRYGTGLKELTI